MKSKPLKLSGNRYDAMEEVRTLLGFTKPEWRILLHALGKTDNSWLQFIFGNVSFDLKKFVDIAELHIRVDAKKNKRAKQSVKYVYDLTDFAQPRELEKG